MRGGYESGPGISTERRMSITPKSQVRGYTLLEMIVSVGIFSIVMLIVTGAYLTLISLDRKARATNQLVSNLSFAIESMTRSIRTGSTYSCNGAGNGTCSRFSFVDSQGRTVTYLLKSDGSIGQCTSGTCVDATAIALTDPKITLSALTFYVRGVGTSDTIEPQVTISLRGTLESDPGKTTDFAIQSSATQRFLEI